MAVGWLALAGCVVFVSQLSNTIWAFANPAPHHWDNADYLNWPTTTYWAYSLRRARLREGHG